MATFVSLAEGGHYMHCIFFILLFTELMSNGLLADLHPSLR
jgi:hypothetical protein